MYRRLFFFTGLAFALTSIVSVGDGWSPERAALRDLRRRVEESEKEHGNRRHRLKGRASPATRA